MKKAAPEKEPQQNSLTSWAEERQNLSEKKPIQMKRCWDCKQLKSEFDFSGSQWKRRYADPSTCTTCQNQQFEQVKLKYTFV